MAAMTRLAESRLCPDEELNAFMVGLTGEGAVVSFVGLVRDSDRGGAAVEGLHLDHYPGVTEASLMRIAQEASARFTIAHSWIVHRCGFVAAGEPIVFVAAAAAHRRVAFEAADYLMDRLKTEAAFWKREDGASGQHWIEPTDQDHVDRGRWD
jgi:molybdopterin synthase catalytic subunit